MCLSDLKHALLIIYSYDAIMHQGKYTEGQITHV